MVGLAEERGEDREGGGVVEDGAEGDGRRLDGRKVYDQMLVLLPSCFISIDEWAIREPIESIGAWNIVHTELSEYVQ